MCFIENAFKITAWIIESKHAAQWGNLKAVQNTHEESSSHQVSREKNSIIVLNIKNTYSLILLLV